MTIGVESAETTSDPGQSPAPARSSTALGRYHPGLDGLRAVAMFLMLAYHAEFAWAKGAFLSLSQFFTLSGFLIMSVLLRRSGGTGDIGLRQFWANRFRRLMPAALLGLVVVVAFGATVADASQLRSLPGQVLGCLLYVVNWVFVFTQKSYIDLFTSPSPVQHYWSLAVEEQFYLLMPLGLWWLLRRTRSLRSIGLVFGGVALLSTVELIVLYSTGSGFDRVYYGTDTRASEIVVGVVLAVVLARNPIAPGTRLARALPWLGVAGMAITIWCWVNVPITSSFMWHGGIFLFSMVSIVIITSVVSGDGPLTRVLALYPLAAMGRITYGIYIFHWPIFLWIDHNRTGLSPWPLFGVRLIVTFTAAIASYHLVEMPIRNGTLKRIPTNARFALGPVAACLIIIATVIVSGRTVVDPLAPLTAASATDPEVAPLQTDGHLDVVVIADAKNQALAQAVVANAAGHDDRSFTLAEPFHCDGVPAGQTTCSNWTAEWGDLVARKDPDAVLMLVDHWSPEQMRIDSGLGPNANGVALQKWVNPVMAAGLDILTAKGATVLYGQFPTSGEDAFRVVNEPLGLEITALGNTRRDLRFYARDKPAATTMSPEQWNATVAASLVEDLALYDRATSGGGARVLVVGDSMAETAGWGLQKWGADTGKANVWNTATVGCGVATGGKFLAQDGTPTKFPAKCAKAPTFWASQLEQFQPDVVFVMSSVWDLGDRQLDGWPDFESPGDPEFDAWLLAQYEHAVDTLTSTGARLVWALPPCTTSGKGYFLPQTPDAFDISRLQHLNQDILPQLVAARPGKVTLYDTYTPLCPGDEFVNDIDGVTDVRPDGIHFGTDGAIWFGQRFGDDILTAGS